MDLVYGSTKTYTHSVGFSCCFRQWKADSHCNMLHGYALQIKLTFETEKFDLSKEGWVQDFGGLKQVKQDLAMMFDHTCLVAENDPELPYFITLNAKRLVDLRIVQGVGCEAFALQVYEHIEALGFNHLTQVEVSEHEGNSAYVRMRYVSHGDR